MHAKAPEVAAVQELALLLSEIRQRFPHDLSSQHPAGVVADRDEHVLQTMRDLRAYGTWGDGQSADSV
jgi:hypothetical protein